MNHLLYLVTVPFGLWATAGSLDRIHRARAKSQAHMNRLEQVQTADLNRLWTLATEKAKAEAVDNLVQPSTGKSVQIQGYVPPAPPYRVDQPDMYTRKMQA